MHSAESTGNHRDLAASSVVGHAPHTRRRQRPLPERALERLDRWANAASATSGEERRTRQRAAKDYKDDSCEPTYVAGLRQPATSPNRRPLFENSSPPRTKIPSKADNFDRKAGAEQYAGPGSKGTRDSSAETLVDEPIRINNDGYRKDHNAAQLLLPSGVKMGEGLPTNLTLPDDITGVTSALGSPAKTRYGVQHAKVSKQVGRKELPTRRAHLQELKQFVLSIEEELESTKERLNGIERREDEIRNDVRMIRDEVQGRKTPRSTEEQGDDVVAGKFAAMSRHIEALNNDLHTYRSLVDDIHSEDRRVQSSDRPLRPTSQLPYAQDRNHDHKEYRQLQDQVAKIEAEMRRLNVVVESAHFDRQQGGAKPSRNPFGNVRRGVRVSMEPAMRGTRSDEVEDMVEGAYATSSTLPKPRAAYVHSEEEDDDDDDEDRTPRVTAAGKVRQPARKAPVTQQLDDSYVEGGADEDITMAEERVDRTLRSIMRPSSRSKHHVATQTSQEEAQSGNMFSLEHDAKNCTVCSHNQKKDAKRATRRERIAANLRRQEIGGAEEDLLLSFLKGGASAGDVNAKEATRLSSPQVALLVSLVKQHMDEFIHQRLLYAELADEVKTMHPDTMNRSRRRILVEHVMEAVEELEQRARKIETLKSLLPSGGQTGEGEVKGSRKKTHSPSSGATAMPASGSRKTHGATTLSRALANSPPMVDGAAADSRR